MEEVEQKALSTFHPAPRFWKRYVHNTVTVLPVGDIECFCDHTNAVNSQFTIETESNVSFPSWMFSRKSDGTIITSVFRKSTHMDRYFCSHHPMVHKVSVVRILFTRASFTSPSLVQCATEKLHITNVLKANGYPQCFVRRHDHRHPKMD
jgi:hypothetical protein